MFYVAVAPVAGNGHELKRWLLNEYVYDLGSRKPGRRVVQRVCLLLARSFIFIRPRWAAGLLGVRFGTGRRIFQTVCCSVLEFGNSAE